MPYRFVLGFALSLLAYPLTAGVVYEIESTDHRGDAPQTAEHLMTVEGKNLSMTIRDAKQGDGKMIFRGDRSEIVIVDHDEKSYFIVDRQMMDNLSSQVDSALQQAQEALKNVPEAQRAMVEKMLKERMPQATEERPKSTLQKTQDTGTHDGQPTIRYDVLLNGQKQDELWVTDWDHIEGGEDVADVFLEMSNFFNDLMDAVHSMGGGALGSTGQDVFFEHLRELDGFPVVTRGFEDGHLMSESVLRSATRRALSPDEFEPPAGYKRRQMIPTGEGF